MFNRLLNSLQTQNDRHSTEKRGKGLGEPLSRFRVLDPGPVKYLFEIG